MQILILSLLVIILILLSICIYQQRKEGFEVCAQSLSKAYLPYKCLHQPNFQTSCVQQVQDNQTVSQLIAEQACAMSEPMLTDEPIYPFY